MKKVFILLGLLYAGNAISQPKKKTADALSPASLVNVFLGSSGDHGQMSPAASYPFSMLSICPETYPKLHMGYEHKAKICLGFTHNRFEGVGCQGSGGNILIKPFTNDDAGTKLIKASEAAGPGWYSTQFVNGIKAKFTVYNNQGIENYTFPDAKNGFDIDLSHTLANRFVNEQHQVTPHTISGWVESSTTCNVGVYRIYYYIMFDNEINWSEPKDHHLLARFTGKETNVRIAFSSVDTTHVKAAIGKQTFDQLKNISTTGWNKALNRVEVSGDRERQKLFYSLLYRTIQSPYIVSEPDGAYRGTDGTLQHTTDTVYNGWAIWDNYRTQLPLLSLLYPDRYKQIASSIASLYRFGKKDYATKHEPSNTVRTEHAIVVLLDAYRKGYIDKASLPMDSLVAENSRLDYSHPDKALESSYDTWALAELFAETGNKVLSEKYKLKALEYKTYWNKDFKDLTKRDVDRIPARNLYQGTVWQYRWFVPFDIKGLMALTGGEQTYIQQLDEFFDNDYYNHANEPDIQAPLMYNMTNEPWKSQALMHKLAADTVIQYYFNDNSRGIDPFVDVIYQNRPDAYIRTMDDDAGAMSAWYVFAACGFSPACIGWPVYYLNVPLFKNVKLNQPGKKSFEVQVENFSPTRRYISKVYLNGRLINRNWITQKEIMDGGTLVITASDNPVKTFGTTNKWLTDATN
ncbi:MAG TPA: glycoside hydrolase domain-containing protein [Mucilaginibacter sp.]